MPIFLPGEVERDYQAPAEFATTFDDYRKAKWAEGLGSNPLQLYEDYSAFESANNQPKLKLDDINSRLDSEGIKMDVPQDGLSAQALDMLIGRKKKNQKLQEAIEYSPGGMRSLAGFGVTLGASFMDPLNIGLAFVPAVGPARYAAMVKGASSAFGRAGVRAGVGAAEGALGTAIIEPFMYGAHQALRDDYTAVDSLINIGVGSVFGGGLHVVGGAGVDAYKKWRTSEGLDIPVLTETLTNAPQPIKTVADDVVPQPVDDMPAVFSSARYDPNSAAAVAEFATPQTREVALRSAVAQIVEGRHVDVDVAFNADPSNPRAKVPTANEFVINNKELIQEIIPLLNWATIGNKRIDDAAGNQIARSKFEPVNFELDEVRKESGLSYNALRQAATKAIEGAPLSKAESRAVDLIASYAETNKDVLKKTPITDEMLAKARENQAIEDAEIGYQDGMSFDDLVYGSPSRASINDQITSAAARQAAPESVRVADVEGAKAADEKLATAPKSESLQDAEAELAKVMANLEERLGMPPKTDEPAATKKASPKPQATENPVLAELKIYDEAIASADQLSLAAKAAAICDMRG